LLRIGSVPYLNGKPLVDWFHTNAPQVEFDLSYAVPSLLAAQLRAGEIDVANCSIFEGFVKPGLVLIPDISISADGAVKSVRLFSRVPLSNIRTVALDTSSLTSSALVQILLSESHGINPQYVHHPPELDAMLQQYDAGLIIGDLKLFDLRPDTTVYDLGQGWKELTGLPFVYAGWLAREDRVCAQMANALTSARDWGLENLEALALKWSARMNLPLDRCQDYLINVMDYHLGPTRLQALRLFQQKCVQHNLISAMHPLPIYGATN
jgi:chorismate dehydratase